jgi:hypothetical protein
MPVPLQKPLTRRPILSAIISVCIFLFWHLPEWLGNVWPLFSDTPLPQWIAERRWPGMSPELFSWISMGLGIGILILLGIILVTTHQQNQLRREFDQIPILRAQLAAKEEEISRLHQRPVHHPLSAPSPSAFTHLPNAELQRRSLDIVPQLHDLLARLKEKEHQRRSPYPHYPPNISREEEQQHFLEHIREDEQIYSPFLLEYNKRFKTDMILLRDEMRRRLPTPKEGTSLSLIDRQYEKPTNSLSIEAVISNFERLAKSLPTHNDNQ